MGAFRHPGQEQGRVAVVSHRIHSSAANGAVSCSGEVELIGGRPLVSGPARGTRRIPPALASTFTRVRMKCHTSSLGRHLRVGTKPSRPAPGRWCGFRECRTPSQTANRGDEEAWVVGVPSFPGIEARLKEQTAYFAGLTGGPTRGTWLSLVTCSASLLWVRPLTSSLGERRITRASCSRCRQQAACRRPRVVTEVQADRVSATVQMGDAELVEASESTSNDVELRAQAPPASTKARSTRIERLCRPGGMGQARWIRCAVDRHRWR